MLITQTLTLKAARTLARAHNVNGTLLAAPLSNPKIAKGEKIGVLTAPMHLAPASLSGYNTCAMATAGCRAACLNTAGNPAYAIGKARARLARTKFYFEKRDLFISVLISEIRAHVRSAVKKNMIAAVRLNATSDIPWEKVAFQHEGRNYANVMEMFPDVEFYDYTKRANRRNLPKNYTLTFSLAENNDAEALQAIGNGLNVAVVFNVNRNRPLPSKFAVHDQTMNMAVVDGDVHDYRPSDPKGVFVGLRAKGKARTDESGFVRKA